MAEVVYRSPRVRPPAPARTAFDLQAPPPLEPAAKLQPVQLLVPVLGSMSILVYGVMARTAVLLVTGGIMALASMTSPLVLHWSGRRSQRVKLARRRERYRLHLSALAAEGGAARAALLALAADPHPSPRRFDAWAGCSRLWERHLEDGDLLAVSLGTADGPSGVVVERRASGTLDADPDEELTAEADAVVSGLATTADAPLVLDLGQAGVVAVDGDRAAALALVRAVLIELALTCAPDDLCVLAAFPPAEVGTWAWLTWLPHTAASTAGLHNGPADRLLATSAEELERQLRAVVTPRLRMLEERTWDGAQQVFARAVIVVDRFDPLTELGRAGTLTQTLARAAQVGVTVLTVCDPGALAPTETTALITVAGGEGSLRMLGAPSAPRVFTPVALDPVQAERLARRLSPKRLLSDSIRAGRAGSGRLADLLEGVLPDAGLLGAAQGRAQRAAAGPWPEQPSSALLRVPFAVTADGSPLVLDLKESADGGYGPHGLVVGAVGSGKSELLRTLVSGLVAIHSPDDVELAFADFKGGLTFSLLHQVPHCSGMITNLADDLSLVDRMKAALTGELERRQQQLRSAGGDVQKISQYRELRRLHPQLPPMPYLVVVVDEFGELLDARPDVLDVLLSVGRTGRSLGVHLVLASQRLETGRTRGLDSYLGYRICLRTFTPEDSLTVLSSRVAADLPPLPGHGYLRTGAGLVRFVAATVSSSRDRCGAAPPARRFVVGAGVFPEARQGRMPAGTPAGAEGDSDLAVLVHEARRAGQGRCRPPLWLPPLPRPGQPGALTLADRRLDLAVSPPAEGLPVPVGLVDLPTVRRQVPLTLDPAALDGHLLVVGAPRTGKTTVLASYAVQAARRYPASMVEFHVVDLGGGALAPLAALPNVGACVDGQDPASVRRVLAELERLLDERARQMRRHGVHDLPRWRGLVTAGQVQGPAHTVLLLDQLVSFRERFADLDAVLGRLLVEGPSAGVHVAMTSARWGELPARRLEQVSTRIELRLNDVMESQHGRAAAASVPAGVPGRGLRTDGALVQVAAPGEGSGAGDLRGAVHLAAALAGSRWPGQSAAPLRRLADLAVGEWVEAAHTAGGSGGLLLGIAEARFEPVALAPGAGVTVLAYGDAGGGRSSMLARLVAEASALPSPARPQVYVLDYLGSLLERCTDTSAVAAAALAPQEAPDVLAALTDELERRQVAVTAARRDGAVARHLSPVWLVADDYELVHAAARPGLMAELAVLVPYAARLNFGLLFSQVAGGSAARVDPLVRRVLEGSPWHLQFGVESKLELLLKGTRGAPLPAGQALLTRPGLGDALLQVLPPPAPVAAAAPAAHTAPAAGIPAAAAVADAARPRIRLVS